MAYDKTPIMPIITPPTIPPIMSIDPLDISPDTLVPPFRRLVATTAADPLGPDPEAAKLPVADGDTSGTWGAMLFVGAETPFMEAA
jgi:hypothetical protein